METGRPYFLIHPEPAGCHDFTQQQVQLCCNQSLGRRSSLPISIIISTVFTTQLFNKNRLFILAAAIFGSGNAFAQGGTTGINAATSSLTSYVDPVSTLILAIGAVVGLIGGVRVYIKWNSGDQDINKELMSWGGSCLFLVLVSVVIKAFFGV